MTSAVRATFASITWRCLEEQFAVDGRMIVVHRVTMAKETILKTAD